MNAPSTPQFPISGPYRTVLLSSLNRLRCFHTSRIDLLQKVTREILTGGAIYSSNASNLYLIFTAYSITPEQDTALANLQEENAYEFSYYYFDSYALI